VNTPARTMAREETPQRDNDVFALTSFLYGGNADYIEELYAAYETDPNSVNAEWREFFANLGDNPQDVLKNASGASWEKNNWPVTPKDELTSALDGNWAEVEKHVTDKLKGKAAKGDAKAAAGAPLSAEEITQAARDSVRAIMMIRAYRMRGHLHANLDPLGLAEKPNDYNELAPENYGFTPADYNRKIFIDNVLGLEYATVPEMLEILKRTYCGNIGVEFMHISDPVEKAWIQERIEGPRLCPFSSIVIQKSSFRV